MRIWIELLGETGAVRQRAEGELASILQNRQPCVLETGQSLSFDAGAFSCYHSRSRGSQSTA